MAKYILRLDDAASNMNLENWVRILNICDNFNIKPIIAVVPKLEDPKLLKYPNIKNYWETLQKWQKQGYTIAIHGYNHLYSEKKQGLVNPRKKSEFSGLSFAEQKEKIQKSIEVFNSHNIHPKIFIAPGHNFDKTTIKALIAENIKYISDGFFLNPIKYLDIHWIPQQLSKGEKKLFGTYTICLHPNTMSEHDFQQIHSFIKHQNSKFLSFNDLNFKSSIVQLIPNLIIHYISNKKRFIKFKIKEMIIKQ